jgi:hypothetical protein
MAYLRSSASSEVWSSVLNQGLIQARKSATCRIYLWGLLGLLQPAQVVVLHIPILCLPC